MNNRINIVFLIGRVSERGGISRVVSIITRELVKIDHYNIFVLGYQQRETGGYDWNEKIKFHNLLNKRTPMKKGIFKAGIKLRDFISSNKIDVLIACGHIVGPLGVFGSMFTNTKLIYWSHTSFKKSKDNKFRVLNEHIAALLCKSVISLTKTDQVNYKKYTFAKEVNQIYNPVDNQLENLNHAYNINSKLIISIGRLSDQKNFLQLVEVAKNVLDKSQDWSWHIYGSGELYEKIQNKIESVGLLGRLILKGQSSNLYELYPNYSIMVMTSKYEGFPMTLIEGMATKLPLISFDIETGPNEIIKDNVNGYLIRPFEVSTMANKILYLIKNAEKRLEFSQANESLIDEFNINSIIDKWVAIINDISSS